jgi:hypothetical protein
MRRGGYPACSPARAELLNRFARPLGRSGDVTGVPEELPGVAGEAGTTRDRVDLDEEVGMGEALDDGGRDDRRIGESPHARWNAA